MHVICDSDVGYVYGKKTKEANKNVHARAQVNTLIRCPGKAWIVVGRWTNTMDRTQKMIAESYRFPSIRRKKLG